MFGEQVSFTAQMPRPEATSETACIKGVSFKRNCGAASMGEDNWVI